MSESLWDDSVREFRERVGAPTPTPGGGAVAAVTATLGAALLRMVCGISLRHAPRENLGFIQAITARVRTCETALARYADDDMRAFDAYMEARRNGPGAATETLLLECASVPMAGAEAAQELQSLLKQIEPMSPEFAASDLATSANLLRASRESLLANVKINLDALSERAERRELQTRYDRIAESIHS